MPYHSSDVHIRKEIITESSFLGNTCRLSSILHHFGNTYASVNIRKNLSSARVNWLTQVPTQRKADNQGYFAGWNHQILSTADN